MANRTLNLYDGLECMAYLSSDYYDGSIGSDGGVVDKSGNEEHVAVSSGVTFKDADQARNNFGTASFVEDSTDTVYFYSPSTSHITGDQTYWALFKRDSEYSGSEIGPIFEQKGNSGTLSLKTAEGNLDGRVFTTDADPILNIPYTLGKWTPVVWTLDTVNDVCELRTPTHRAIDPMPGDPNDKRFTIQVGNTAYTDAGFGGDIAVAATWSRTLTEAERKQLLRTTGPRRVML